MVAENDVREMAARAHLVLSDDEFAGVVRLVNETGNLAPELAVVERFKSGSLSRGMLTFFLPRMWRFRLGHSPVPVEVWRAMFEFAEYTEDMVVQRPRRGTWIAYRGATEANREGLSWTLDVEQARYFARDRQATTRQPCGSPVSRAIAYTRGTWTGSRRSSPRTCAA